MSLERVGAQRDASGFGRAVQRDGRGGSERAGRGVGADRSGARRRGRRRAQDRRRFDGGVRGVGVPSRRIRRRLRVARGAERAAPPARRRPRGSSRAATASRGGRGVSFGSFGGAFGGRRWVPGGGALAVLNVEFNDAGPEGVAAVAEALEPRWSPGPPARRDRSSDLGVVPGGGVSAALGRDAAADCWRILLPRRVFARVVQRLLARGGRRAAPPRGAARGPGSWNTTVAAECSRTRTTREPSRGPIPPRTRSAGAGFGGTPGRVVAQLARGVALASRAASRAASRPGSRPASSSASRPAPRPTSAGPGATGEGRVGGGAQGVGAASPLTPDGGGVFGRRGRCGRFGRGPRGVRRRLRVCARRALGVPELPPGGHRVANGTLRALGLAGNRAGDAGAWAVARCVTPRMNSDGSFTAARLRSST